MQMKETNEETETRNRKRRISLAFSNFNFFEMSAYYLTERFKIDDVPQDRSSCSHDCVSQGRYTWRHAVCPKARKPGGLIVH